VILPIIGRDEDIVLTVAIIGPIIIPVIPADASKDTNIL